MRASSWKMCVAWFALAWCGSCASPIFVPGRLSEGALGVPERPRVEATHEALRDASTPPEQGASERPAPTETPTEIAPEVCVSRIEVCNGIDDDCDGQIDEAFAKFTLYRDADGDGYGDPDALLQSCRVLRGYVSNGLDCDDGDKRAHPHQALYFAQPRKNGSFDFNCNGKEELQHTRLMQCHTTRRCVASSTGYWQAVPKCGESALTFAKCILSQVKPIPTTCMPDQTTARQQPQHCR